MTFNFDNSKKLALSKKDKSDKKSFDNIIRKLCEKLNKNNNYFTTSSCSGRIVLIIDEEKKKPGLFLFRSHKKIHFNSLKKEIREIINNKVLKSKLKNKTVYFKQEPCLLVVSCRNNESQLELFNKARNNGWKKSGILSLSKKMLVELMSTENISFPLINNEKLIVDNSFLKLIIRKTNSNLERGWKKIKRLEKLF